MSDYQLPALSSEVSRVGSRISDCTRQVEQVGQNVTGIADTQTTILLRLDQISAQIAEAMTAQAERDQWKKAAEANIAVAEKAADAANETANEQDALRARVVELEIALRRAQIISGQAIHWDPSDYASGARLRTTLESLGVDLRKLLSSTRDEKP